MGSAISIPDDKQTFSEQECKDLLGPLYDGAKFPGGSVTRKQIESFAILSQPLAEVAKDCTKSCEERVQASLDAIATRNGDINACVEVLEEAALEEARAADAKLSSGGVRRALEGVPIIVKCNIDVAGSLSSNGTPALKNFRPNTTAPSIARLKEAGAIIVAKTNMPESAMGFIGWNAVHGLTKNPVNPKYVTGGSSSGSAAGVSAGFAPCGIGSDTGGSCRVPAACCGVPGFRPSRGRYPSEGVVPCSPSHDTVGPMASSVADIALVDAIMAGEPAAEVGALASLEGVGVALAIDCYKEAGDAHKKALDLSARAFEKAGAKQYEPGVEFLKATPFDFEKILCWREKGMDDYLASHDNCSVTTADLLKMLNYDQVLPLFHTVKPPMHKTLTGGELINVKSVPADELPAVEKKYAAQLKEYEAQYAKLFEDAGVEVIMAPTFHGDPMPCLTEKEYMGKKFAGVAPTFAMLRGSGQIGFFNEIPVPGARHEALEGAKIPASVLLWGKPGADRKLLQIGMALEKALKEVPRAVY